MTEAPAGKPDKNFEPPLPETGSDPLAAQRMPAIQTGSEVQHDEGEGVLEGKRKPFTELAEQHGTKTTAEMSALATHGSTDRRHFPTVEPAPAPYDTPAVSPDLPDPGTVFPTTQQPAGTETGQMNNLAIKADQGAGETTLHKIITGLRKFTRGRKPTDQLPSQQEMKEIRTQNALNKNEPDISDEDTQ